MIKNKKAEGLIGVIIGVFVLSIIILGITNLMITNFNIIGDFQNIKNINILKKNTGKIVGKIDTSGIKEGEFFYLYNNRNLKRFEVFTGAINSEYKYIDKDGYKIDDINNYSGDIYSRILWIVRDDTSVGKQHQIIKASIKKLVKR